MVHSPSGPVALSTACEAESYTASQSLCFCDGVSWNVLILSWLGWGAAQLDSCLFLVFPCCFLAEVFGCQLLRRGSTVRQAIKRALLRGRNFAVFIEDIGVSGVK